MDYENADIKWIFYFVLFFVLNLVLVPNNITYINKFWKDGSLNTYITLFAFPLLYFRCITMQHIQKDFFNSLDIHSKKLQLQDIYKCS